MASLDVLPETNEDYGTMTYWNERYRKETDETAFDWFKTYKDIEHIVKQVIPDKSSRILMLGCGNSKLSEEMYDDGYHNIVNVDYSSVVIEQMKERHQESRPSMKWHEMDVRQLSFEDSTFDVTIDKGTMDAMMTSKGDVWDPPEHVIDACTKEVNEVIRVLKKGSSVFLYITFGQPHFRKRFLTRQDTRLEVHELGEMFHYYVYIMKT
ncbi:S-adenosyl-L-methionine-dependent methyltransferase [Phellopilus nigrolimitatus]|nr:S-adenosyl-L-methionine-dependent methyltransferase [Phellopilus nigrolimitatus]